jgi:hypothetical protein
LTVEDKLLDEEKSISNRELFIPVAAGLTCFLIEAHKGNNYVDSWNADTLPRTIRITISFVQPDRDISGNYSIFESDLITRTVAIDRTRQIKFSFVAPDLNEFDANYLDINDSNLSDSNLYDYNDINEPNIVDEI